MRAMKVVATNVLKAGNKQVTQTNKFLPSRNL